MLFLLSFLKAQDLKPNYIGLNLGHTVNGPGILNIDLFYGRSTSPLFDFLLYLKNDYLYIGSNKSYLDRMILSPNIKWRFHSIDNFHFYAYGGMAFFFVFYKDSFTRFLLGLNASVGVELYINNTFSVGLEYSSAFPFQKFEEKYLYTGKLGIFGTFQF